MSDEEYMRSDWATHCGICGAEVIINCQSREGDSRMMPDGIRCFDHIGVPLEKKGGL